jgi:hypothetical protein
MLPSRQPIGESGCLVCCLAQLLTEVGVRINPAQLTNFFICNQVFTIEGNLRWDKALKALPELVSALDAGDSKLYRVSNRGNGHYVLRSSAKGVFDPLVGAWENA